MVSTSQRKTQPSEKLLSELSFREGLTVYLEAWKELIWAGLKSFIVVGVCLVAVELASAFLAVSTVVGIILSALTFVGNFITTHPFLTGAFVVAVFLTIASLRVRAISR